MPPAQSWRQRAILGLGGFAPMPAPRRSQTLAPLMLGFVVATGVIAVSILRPPHGGVQATARAADPQPKSHAHSAVTDRCKELAKGFPEGAEADWERALAKCETEAARDPKAASIPQGMELAR